MTRAEVGLGAATALGAAAFLASGAVGWIAAVAAAGVAIAAGLSGRPGEWTLRAGYALLIAYLAAWGYARFDAWRLSQAGQAAFERLEETRREGIAAALERRLELDRALAVRVAAVLSRETAAAGRSVAADPDLFVVLERAAPPTVPEGVGIEVYDAAGSLRAWWGEARGDRLAGDSIAAALAGSLVRRPAGYTIAYAGVPWEVEPDTFAVVVKDVWAVESPLRRGGVETSLFLPALARSENLDFRVLPVDPAAEAEGPVTPVVGSDGAVVAGVVTEVFRLDRFLDGRRRTTERLLVLLLAWPLAWAVGRAWRAARRRARAPDASRPALGWTIAILGQLTVLGALWAFLLESRIPSLVLPSGWFSPLAFALPVPGGRSPGDFALTAAFAALTAIATYSLLSERRPSRTLRWTGIVVAASLIGWAQLARIGLPAIERALGNMSPSVFFSPTLLFSAPFLLVLAGFAMLAAVGVVATATGLRLVGAPAGPGWTGVAGATTAVAVVAAAWRLPEAALAGELAPLVPVTSIGAVAAAWLAYVTGRPGAFRPSDSAIRFAVAAIGLAALVVLPGVAFARVQAAHDRLVERAQRLGEASTQWLQYTMARTVEYLATEPDVDAAILDANRDAALLLWSQSPLRAPDFASGLYLVAADGTVVSQFALTAVDLSGRARRRAIEAVAARIDVEGRTEEGGIWWATVPVYSDTVRVGTAVAMATGAAELREPSPDAAFVLTDLLAGTDRPAEPPGAVTLGTDEIPAPRTLLTRVGDPSRAVQLAMPLDPLLPGARTYAVFGFVGAILGLALGGIERSVEDRGRGRRRSTIETGNPLRSFRIQLLLAFLAVAAIPLTMYAVLGYRATRQELEEATRSAAAEALTAASRLVVGDEALERGTGRVLSGRLREIATVLEQDLVLYWRGRTVASSRPEIFTSRLFADRMEGSVYVDLFAERRPLAFESMSLGGRSFLVAYRALREPEAPPGYVLATPLLIREDRARVDLQRLGEGVFLLSAISAAFLLVVSWLLARFMARPLSELERGTRQIAAGRLSYRLPEPARGDEFGRLQRAFNAMAERLDTSQRALEREKSRVQAILASVGAGVVALDEHGRVRLLNDRAALLLDLRPEEVVDRSAESLAEADGAARPFWRAVARERVRHRGDHDLVVRRDGEERHYHVVCTALRDGAGDERGLVVAFEDITENVQSQRVLAWGEMARQVAHEIKNPLTPMKLSLQHLERTVDDRAADFERVFRDNLDLILAEIDRLERIASNFARFAVPDPTAAEPFDAVGVAGEVRDLFGSGDEDVAYAVEVVGEPGLLRGDPDGLRRILVNLLQNAREATLAAGGGRVVVRLDWSREPGWAWISVVDEGIGLPETGLEGLFEPSFSTKTRGTGLGLAITRRIVEAWGGTIEFERPSGGGAAFHVRLKAGPRID